MATRSAGGPRASSSGSRLGLYIDAIKPGITVSNTATAAAAYVFAAQPFSLPTFLGLLLGTALVIASACVVNNHVDRDIDAKMVRTAHRGQATGQIGATASFVYAAALGVLGLVVLLLLTTPAAAITGVVAWLLYAVVYTLAKHRTPHAALIGNVPGALPPVAGVLAAPTPRPADAIALFALLVAWQVVHFYAISIRRRDDYAAADVPVAALAYGVTHTKRLVLAGAVVFLLAALGLGAFGSAGPVATAVLAICALVMLFTAARGQRKDVDATAWASDVFGQTLVVILVLCAVLVLGPLERL